MSNALIPLSGITTGCDPELFVFDRNGNPVSAAGLLPGTKQDPHPVKDGAIQVDGMAAEFNTNPASTFEEFDHNISSVMAELRTYLPGGYTLEAVPSVIFSEKVWNETPEEAKELGCTPDFNAWTGDVNPPPNGELVPRLRTASGHLHIGWCDDAELSDERHIENCRDLVKQLDWYLGGWSLQKDEDNTRRQLYGKAGAMRYKPYGVEYRVLSNFWVKNKATRLEVWNRLHRGILDMRNTFMPDKASNHVTHLIDSINTSNRNISLEKYWSYPLRGISR